ncbi:MAG: hypothetical protein HQK76_16440 [Desulfobacterales bacterium]|nr:hypothetical protein [Desulfobacterales bacterium]
MSNFSANCLPALIGSLPMDDHAEATKMMLKYSYEIPLWVQLPKYKKEGMISQFLEGFPCAKIEDGKVSIKNDDPIFDEKFLEFYEDYIGVEEGTKDLLESRFALSINVAKGFFELIKHLEPIKDNIFAVKGQITGPVTLGTGITDYQGRAIFYDERLRDAIVKLVAANSRWQIRMLSKFNKPVIIFMDEPAVSAYGSSSFISIEKHEITDCINEAIDAIHKEKGIAGIHICSNAEWSLALNSNIDIISFDAYAYFDKFILYSEEIKKFINKGGILAWGIIPTAEPEEIEKISIEILFNLWEKQAAKLETIGIDKSTIIKQSLITPSCGTGTLSLKYAEKVLRLTKELSENLRKKYQVL